MLKSTLTDIGCGKTCLLTVYAERRFPEVSYGYGCVRWFARGVIGQTIRRREVGTYEVGG